LVKLSVIIVNYNVKHFIEQCLFSVYKSSENINCEIFVVDNNSVDGSSVLIKEKFPSVHLIENKNNLGFSAANNQAIERVRGEYVLLLNPDTVVQEDTFDKIIEFMDNHKDAGGLGVKMLDGKGNFAPESKRGLPTPEVAFYKMFGLSKLFPNSKRFGKYHLTYLSENKINEIDVISGAFMLVRKSVLESIGNLDDHFFMYGEDIDLSYRIKKAGYKNYYYPETQIIHYKGESTKRSSLNYIVIFYKAMAVFSKKHFSGSQAFWLNFLIYFAIILKAGFALTNRFFKTFTIPIVDFISIVLSLYVIKKIYLYNSGLDIDVYSLHLVNTAFPLYALIWVIAIYFNGGYDNPIKLLKIIKGVVFGSVFILLAYSLLPESLRFSRALILFGTLSALICVVGIRLLLHIINFKNYTLNKDNEKRIAIIGEEEEFKRVSILLNQTQIKLSFVGFVTTENNTLKHSNFIGNLNQIDEIIKVHQINEIIFCAKDLSSQVIINHMLTLVSSGIDFKIAPPESLSIIGSNHIDTAGDLYMIDVDSISKPNNKRNKRLLDICISLLIISLSPVLFFIQHNKSYFFINSFNVLFGFYSWVGYGKTLDKTLPEIKRSILSPVMLRKNQLNKTKLIHLQYAKDYKIEKDLLIIWKCIRQLGN
jgi:GT2 family glycosyltransferase